MNEGRKEEINLFCCREPSENTRISKNKMSQIGTHIKPAVHFNLIGTNE